MRSHESSVPIPRVRQYRELRIADQLADSQGFPNCRIYVVRIEFERLTPGFVAATFVREVDRRVQSAASFPNWHEQVIPALLGLVELRLRPVLFVWQAICGTSESYEATLLRTYLPLTDADVDEEQTCAEVL